MPSIEFIKKMEKEKKQARRIKARKKIIENVLFLLFIMVTLFSYILLVCYCFNIVKYVDPKTEIKITEKIKTAGETITIFKQGKNIFMGFQLKEDKTEYENYKNRRNK